VRSRAMYDETGEDHSSRLVNKLRTGTHVALAASAEVACERWLIQSWQSVISN